MPVLLRASKITSKHSVIIYADVPVVTPYYKGSIHIGEREFIGRGRSVTTVTFTPNVEGSYYYFTVHQCYPVDGAVIVATIQLDLSTTIQIFKLAEYAIIKKRNLLSREMQILYFQHGIQVYSDIIKGKPPLTIQSTIMDLSTMPPEPSVALTEFIHNLKRF